MIEPASISVGFDFPLLMGPLKLLAGVLLTFGILQLLRWLWDALPYL